jgi:glycosyltransferase involved in cell wall biosynthesis
MLETLVIINAFSGGGAERSMNQLCNQFQKSGLNVELLAIESGPLDLEAFSGKVSTLNRNKGSLGTASALFRFIRFVHKKSIGTALLNCELPELFGLFLPLKTKLIVIQHNPKPWSRNTALGKLVRRLLRARSAIFISVSDHMKVWPDNSSPAAVIPNPLTINYQPIQSTSDVLERLIYIGRLVDYQKNPQQVIRIANQVRLPVKFIGTGNFKSGLEAFARHQGVTIEFAGYHNNPWCELAPGDLLIVPSLEEGDGLVVLEACAANVPILLSDIPDFRKFELGNQHYCISDEDYVAAIEEYRIKLTRLKVNVADAKRLISERDVSKIEKKWLPFFNS